MPLNQRLNPDEANQVLSRAADLQQKHLETVSVEQLEALASEVGLSPEFIRQALDEVGTAPVQRTVEAPRVATTGGITRKGIVAAAVGSIPLPIALGVALGAIHNRTTSWQLFEFVVVAMVLTGVLSAGLGFVARSRRLGGIAGALMGYLMFLSLYLVQPERTYPMIEPSLIVAALGAGFGVAGAGLRRLWDRAPHDR